MKTHHWCFERIADLILSHKLMHKDREVVHVTLGYLKNSWELVKWLEGYEMKPIVLLFQVSPCSVYRLLPAALANPSIPDCCQEVQKKNTPARQIVNCINSKFKYNCHVDIWFIGMFALIIVHRERSVINSTGKQNQYSQHSSKQKVLQACTLPTLIC